MASQSLRLMDSATLAPNQVSARDGAADLGAYGNVQAMFRAIRPGTANDQNAVVFLEHAAVNEAQAWAGLPNTSVRVDTAAPAGTFHVSVPAFARYIRWATGVSGFAGNPIVTIDLVAKE